MKLFLKYNTRENNVFSKFFDDVSDKYKPLHFDDNWRYYIDKELAKYKATLVVSSGTEVYLYFPDERHKSLFLLKYS